MENLKKPIATTPLSTVSSAKIKETQLSKGQADHKTNELQEVTDVISSLP